MAKLILSTTESINQTQDQTFTIPGMTKFNSVTSNTGTVTTTNVTRDKVTIRAINGTKTKTEQTGGSYTPADSKPMTTSTTNTTNSFSDTLYYNSGGYSGTLIKSGAAVGLGSTRDYIYDYVVSKGESGYGGQGYSSYSIGVYSWTTDLNIPGNITFHLTMHGHSGSGSTTLYIWYMSVPQAEFDADWYPTLGNGNDKTLTPQVIDSPTSVTYRLIYNHRGTYGGGWRQNYSGTVTKPAVDTRTYADYYQYNLTFDYETNNIPKLTLNTASNKVLNENDTIIVDGQTIDLDAGNIISVKYQINDNFTQTILTTTSDSITQIPFSKTLTFKGGKLYDGNNAVTTALLEGVSHLLKVWTEDDKGGRSIEQTRNFNVIPAVRNKRNPSISVNNKNEIFVVHENFYNVNDIDIGMFKKSNDKWIDKDILTSSAKESAPSTLEDKMLDFDVPPFIYKHDTKIGFYGSWINLVKPLKPNIVGVPTIVNPRDRVYLSTSGSNDIYNDNLTYFYEFFDGTVWREIATDKVVTETITHIIPQVIGGVNNAKYRIRSYNGKLFSDYTESNKFVINAGPTDIIEVDKIVVDKSYNVSGNGGRKLVKLDNGWLVAAAVSTETSNPIYFYINKQDGTGFKQLCKLTAGNQAIADNLALASYGNFVIAVFQKNDGTNDSVYSVEINVLTQTNVEINSLATLLSTEKSLSGISISTNEAKTELHVAFASKNATYANSFNIRYIKGEININGSILWGKIEQWTTYDVATSYAKNPSITVNSLNEPLIISELKTSVGHFIVSIGKGGQILDTNIKKPYVLITFTDIYVQSSPNAMYVPKTVNKLSNGRIWAAWHGTDIYSPTVNNIKLSYSDDNGSSWKQMKI